MKARWTIRNIRAKFGGDEPALSVLVIDKARQ
jgi:hypothetical protein